MAGGAALARILDLAPPVVVQAAAGWFAPEHPAGCPRIPRHRGCAPLSSGSLGQAVVCRAPRPLHQTDNLVETHTASQASFGFPSPLGSPERSGTPRYAAERRVTRSGTPGVERDCPFCQCQHTAVRKSHAGGRRLLAAATNAVCGHSVALAFPPLGSPKRSGMPRYAAERRGTLGHAGRRDCHFVCPQEIRRAVASPRPRRRV